MALIKCPECGKEVSSLSETCIGCGYPIRDYAEEEFFKSEVDRLTLKILPVEFATKEPRMKVCIKCGAVFSAAIGACLKNPTCECRIGKHKYPGVEVDYPYYFEADDDGCRSYIYENCIESRNIGDRESQEYQTRIRNHLEEVEKTERYFERKILVRPPYIDYYGRPMSEERIDKETRKAMGTYEFDPPPPREQKPKCPHCGSTSLTKLSNVKSFAKILTFGLAGAGDVGKTYKCNNCGSRL